MGQALSLASLDSPSHFLSLLSNDPKRAKMQGYVVQLYLLVLELFLKELSPKQQSTAVLAVLKSLPDEDRHT